jgi:hypothetical protein
MDLPKQAVNGTDVVSVEPDIHRNPKNKAIHRKFAN